MEVDQQSPMKSGEVTGPGENFSLFRTIKEDRNGYGVRSGTYGRYKKHCLVRIGKLRTQLQLQGTTIPSKETSETTSTDLLARLNNQPSLLKEDIRYLTLLLYEIERSWSMAMTIKTDTTKSDRAQHQVTSRLKKARKVASGLEVASDGVELSDRVKLEAKAYSWYMHGYHASESRAWKDALEYLSASSEVLEKLATSELTSSEDKALFHSFCDEIEPTLRFCSYNLDRSDESMDETTVNRSDLLNTIASSLKEYSHSGDDSVDTSLFSMVWFGNTIELRSSELSRLHHQATEAEKAIFSSDTMEEPSQMDQFDLLVGAYADMVQVGAKLAEETKAANEKILSSKSAELNHQLRLFQTCASQRFHTSMILRNWVLCQQHFTLNTATPIPQVKFTGKVEEVAQLIQKILQALDTIAKLPLFEEDYDLEQWVVANGSFFKAFRTLFIGHEFVTSQKLAEALSLYQKAHEGFTQSHVAKRLASSSTEILDSILSSEDHERWEAISLALVQQTHATWSVDSARSDSEMLSSISELGIHNKLEPLAVIHCLNQYPRFQSRRPTDTTSSPIQPPLFPFKPTLRPLPFKPVVFDLASKEFSDLGVIGQSFDATFRRCAQLAPATTSSSTSTAEGTDRGVLGNLFSFFGN